MAEEPLELANTKEDCVTDSDQKLYETLDNLLQPESRVTPTETAKQIDDLYSVHITEQADESEADRAEGFLWNFGQR
jgi:hypothetical protein